MSSGVSIILPSAEFSPSFDQEEVVLLHPSGFVDRGLRALHLLNDNGGTTFKDSMGGAPGNLDLLINSNNAFARLAGGGVALSGAQFISFPAYEANGPWTMFTAGAIMGDVGSDFEKITGFVGHRTSYGVNARGSYFYARGATTWGSPANVTDFFHHRTNGDGDAVDESLSPIDQNAAAVHHLIAHSYDGSSTLTSTLYDAAGAVVATGTLAATPAQLFTVSGTTVSMLQPIIGGISDVFDGAIQQFEFFARYTVALSDFSEAEIQAQVAAAAGYGSARSRPWA
ncbi:hypothetical protein U1872_06100 [Sphingomonas sp. RB3P16]|uniref:hypothetical protein n=1 Tax=Parasphingomonas frigoris TaxID=3096163 RepID=UPI002FCB63F4